MSGRSGKPLAEYFASSAFPEFAEHMGRLIKTLGHRNFGDKHFDQTRAIFEHSFGPLPTAVYAEIMDDRSTTGRLAFRSALVHTEEDTDVHRIMQLDLSMEKSSLQISARQYPLRIFAPHLFFRFIQRTGNALDYNSEEFEVLCGMAIMMSFLTPPLVPASEYDPKNPPAAVLPLRDGLVLGNLQIAPTPKTLELVSYHVQQGPQVMDDEGYLTNVAIIPSPIKTLVFEFNAKTSISSFEYKGLQGELSAQLNECFGGTENQAALRQLCRLYVGRIPETPKMQAVLRPMQEKLTAIMQGRAWQEHAQHRTPRTPMN